MLAISAVSSIVLAVTAVYNSRIVFVIDEGAISRRRSHEAEPKVETQPEISIHGHPRHYEVGTKAKLKLYLTIVSRRKIAKSKVFALNDCLLILWSDLDFQHFTVVSIFRLDVSNNELSEIPDVVWSMQSLKFLNLAGNKLETLPSSSNSGAGSSRKIGKEDFFF